MFQMKSKPVPTVADRRFFLKLWMLISRKELWSNGSLFPALRKWCSRAAKFTRFIFATALLCESLAQANETCNNQKKSQYCNVNQWKYIEGIGLDEKIGVAFT